MFCLADTAGAPAISPTNEAIRRAESDFIIIEVFLRLRCCLRVKSCKSGANRLQIYKSKTRNTCCSPARKAWGYRSLHVIATIDGVETL